MFTATLLVVEDDPIIAADLTDRLTDAGYRVVHTDRGEEVVGTVLREQPDLILMDVNLAGKMDGVEAAAAVAAARPTPLVFLTSNTDSPTFARARATRPTAFLTKPFRGRDLLNTVALALDSTDGGERAAGETSPETTAGAFSDRIFIRDRERMVRLLINDILCISADDYYCKVVTAEREYLVTMTLKKFMATLPEGIPFLRVHRSHVVNLRQITEIGEIFVFLGKQQVPVSRAKREELKRAIKNY